ncbi:MAG: phosphotransferase [Chloroflexi bacterium]|nr:phosphotransferase [Chloroflexota bacterium]
MNGEPDSAGDSELVVLREKSPGHPHAVYRRGDVLIREAGPWTPTTHALLRHLEEAGFPFSPRVVGSGFDDQGRETLQYIEGTFTQPGPWSLEGVAAVGELVRDLHEATASFQPPDDAVWWPWFGRPLGSSKKIIGHCDIAPWNIVARDGMPVGLIDWERAGPVDPLVELAEACWLNAKLHDDMVAELEGLPPFEERARQLRAMVDAYGLPKTERSAFVDLIVQFAIHDAAAQADEASVTPETASGGPELIWGLSWRARSAAWLTRHRDDLVEALV